MNTSFIVGQKIFTKLGYSWEPGEILGIYQTQDHSRPQDGGPPCYCLKQPNKGCDPLKTGVCHGQTSTWYTIKLDKDGFEFDTDLPSLRAEKPSYGICQKCGGTVSVPGLDSHYCDRCGWVPDPQWVLSQANSTKGKKHKGGVK